MKKHDVRSALVSAVLMALVVVMVDIIAAGNIFTLDWYALTNAGVIALLTGLVSALKSLLTTKSGKIVGIKVK